MEILSWQSPALTFTFVCDPPPFQDLSSPNQYDTGVALTGLSCFVTPDLARDLANDIMTLVRLCFIEINKIKLKKKQLVVRCSLQHMRAFEYTAFIFF